MLSRLIAQSRFNFSKLYTWGETTLGWGRPYLNEPVYQPKIVNAPPNIAKVVAGASRLALITEDHSLYICGDNYYGELMLGSSFLNKIVDNLTQVSFNHLKGSITDVSLGNRHSVILTSQGLVYVGGHCCAPLNNAEEKIKKAQSAFEDSPVDVFEKIAAEPTLIDPKWFEGNNIVAVQAAKDFTVVQDSRGKLFSWGLNTYPLQWGAHPVTPCEIKTVNDYLDRKHLKIRKFVAVENALMILCNNGKLYALGVNNQGMMGTRKNERVKIDNEHSILVPVVDVQLNGERIVDFESASTSTVALTESGKVFYTGMKIRYQLAPFPQITPKVKSMFATHDAVGVIDVEGRVYYINDKIIDESDYMNAKSKVYVTEEDELNNVVKIGGTHCLRYAIAE